MRQLDLDNEVCAMRDCGKMPFWVFRWHIASQNFSKPTDWPVCQEHEKQLLSRLEQLNATVQKISFKQLIAQESYDG